MPKHMKYGSVAEKSNYGRKTAKMDEGSVTQGDKKRKMGNPSNEEAEEKTTAGKPKRKYSGYGFGM